LGFGISDGRNGAYTVKVRDLAMGGDQEGEDHLGYPYVKLTQGGSGSRKTVLT
jgi:hypothetical protein